MKQLTETLHIRRKTSKAVEIPGRPRGTWGGSQREMETKIVFYRPVLLVLELSLRNRNVRGGVLTLAALVLKTGTKCQRWKFRFNERMNFLKALPKHEWMLEIFLEGMS